MTSNGFKRPADHATALISALRDYIAALEDELKACSAVAYSHGWRSVRIGVGETLREKIKMEEASIAAIADGEE